MKFTLNATDSQRRRNPKVIQPARHICPTGYDLLALISLFLNDSLETNYLRIYRADFHQIFIKWYRYLIWPFFDR